MCIYVQMCIRYELEVLLNNSLAHRAECQKRPTIMTMEKVALTYSEDHFCCLILLIVHLLTCNMNTEFSSVRDITWYVVCDEFCYHFLFSNHHCIDYTHLCM